MLSNFPLYGSYVFSFKTSIKLIVLEIAGKYRFYTLMKYDRKNGIDQKKLCKITKIGQMATTNF